MEEKRYKTNARDQQNSESRYMCMETKTIITQNASE